MKKMKKATTKKSSRFLINFHMSDYSSFRSSTQAIRPPASCTGTCPASSFYPIHPETGSRHAARGPVTPLPEACGSEPDDNSVCSGVRIKFTATHRHGEILQSGFAIQPKLRAHLGERDVLDLSASSRDAACFGASALHL
jgi:hypothetical protein